MLVVITESFQIRLSSESPLILTSKRHSLVPSSEMTTEGNHCRPFLFARVILGGL